MRFLTIVASVLSVAAAVPLTTTSAVVEDVSLEVRGQGDVLPLGNWDLGPLADLLKSIKDQFKNKNKIKASIPKASQFTSWKTFKANGVNLGGWYVVFLEFYAC